MSKSPPGGSPVQDPDDVPEHNPDPRPANRRGLGPEQYWKTRQRLDYLKLLIWIFWFLLTGDTPTGLP